MKSRRITRYLRIAVTATSLTACVLLIALWVRSYWVIDLAYCRVMPRWIELESIDGNVEVQIVEPLPASTSSSSGWRIDSIDREGHIPIHGVPTWGFVVEGNDIFVNFPYWFASLLAAIFAAIPWIKWRFSLRTLLIATTLIAVGLGAVIYLSG